MQRRYELAEELEEILVEEEVYWQQRGREKLVLEGESNTSFFHLAANGRRSKKTILNLEDKGRDITDFREI
jgi:hypothetical protein